MQISELKGVGAKRTHALQSAGIFTAADLLEYFPRDYDDRSKVKTISELIPEAVNTIRGVAAFEPQNAVRKKFSITKLIIKDHTGTLELIWFNQPYLKKYFKKGNEYIFTGKVREAGITQMLSPDYEPSGGTELSGGRIVPIYTPPKQFSQKTFRALIFRALETVKSFADTLPEEVLAKYKLCGRETAVRNIHFPESDELFLSARRRLVFEELFFMQTALLEIKNTVNSQSGIVLEDVDYSPFLQALPFGLTHAQSEVLSDISRDLQSGRCMNRLIQGDVGSGKTAVAFAAIFLAAKNGYQSALMAPTDVLAVQHYSQCEKLFSPFGFETVLLTGSLGAKEKRGALAKTENGTASIVIGTHALIQEKVRYHKLGLCITDEQHRFGVNQRLALSQKGAPHILVMTATPIPRTLGLILYGDLDISVISELPPGRREIKTYCVNSDYRERINGFIRKETEENRRVYIICPSIDEGTDGDLKNVIDYTKTLSAALPEIKTAYLHGRIKPAEKQDIIDSFKRGEIQVLVSTTVIEVGIHVENAALIIIENAERFGLSQLHQLRGRVGRGEVQSYCILVSDSKNEQTAARMKAMTKTSDGFELAELDLKQRGAGDFFGTRQHGLPSFKIANLYRDLDILAEAQEAAREIKSTGLKKRVCL
jgi:ATP-dependent DNA helicase RecG